MQQQSSSQVGQAGRAVQGTLLLIGTGALVDSLARALGSQGLVPERAASEKAAATARAVAPDLILIAGDSARDRGAIVLAKLTAGSSGAPLPALVICAGELGGLVPQPTQRHVGYLSPEGGVNECARRVCALVELVIEQGLSSCSLQQFADTVAPRTALQPGAAPPLPQNKNLALPPSAAVANSPATASATANDNAKISRKLS